MEKILIFFTIVGGAASIIGLLKYSSNSNVNIKQKHYGHGDNIAGDKVINNKPYTSTQSLNMLPPHLGGNDELDLDGSGKLYIIEWTLSSVSLLLPSVPPLSAEGIIQEDTQLGPDHSGHTATFYIHPNIKTADPKVVNASGGLKITLTQSEPKAQVVSGNRTFTLNLVKIKKLPAPQKEKVSDALRTAFDIGINELV